MGLYATVHIDSDWGFPDRTPRLGLPINYTRAIDAFSDTFMKISREEVPVDTGYLRSSLHCSGSGMVIEAEATAEYAQYVEYGTWCCPAQPYFYPAIEAANDVGFSAARQAYDEAIVKEAKIIQKAYQEEVQKKIMAASQAIGGNFIGWLFSLFGMIIIQGITTLFKEFFKDVFGNDDYGEDEH